MHLEPVEHAPLNRFDQIARLDPRLFDRVAADEDRALEHDVVQLPRAPLVGTDRADERSGLEPLAAEDGIPGRGCRDDDVLLGRVTMTLAGLGSDFLAEGAEALLGAAVGDDAFDAGECRADAGDLALRLPAAAEDAERARVLPREVLRRDPAGGTRSQLAELVGLDHRGQLRTLEVEEEHAEGRAAR